MINPARILRSLRSAIGQQKQIQLRIDELAILQGKLLSNQNRGMDASLSRHEFRVFSQWGEDGIIQRLIDVVPIANETFIEFGVETFVEANCRFLMENNNWSGCVIDGSRSNIETIRQSFQYWRHDLNAVHAFITAENIDELLAKSGFGNDPGILSVDIDGVDYWVLSAIRSVRPRIMITEYNAAFGPDRAISVPYDPQFDRHDKHYSGLYFGASLAAFDHWARNNGYALVGTGSAGVNAFFVREDVLPKHLKRLSVKQAYTDSKLRQSRDRNGNLSFLTGDQRLTAMAGLEVINIVNGETEIL